MPITATIIIICPAAAIFPSRRAILSWDAISDRAALQIGVITTPFGGIISAAIRRIPNMGLAAKTADGKAMPFSANRKGGQLI